MFSLHTLVSFFLASLVAVVVSAPLAKRDVFVPPVTYPHKNVVWYTGHRYNVTWDVSNPPKQITNKQGSVVLSKNETLILDHYLAKGFDIMKGWVEVKVPHVKEGDDYAVVVFGDSGNHGEKFSIKHHY